MHFIETHWWVRSHGLALVNSVSRVFIALLIARPKWRRSLGSTTTSLEAWNAQCKPSTKAESSMEYRAIPAGGGLAFELFAMGAENSKSSPNGDRPDAEKKEASESTGVSTKEHQPTSCYGDQRILHNCGSSYSIDEASRVINHLLSACSLLAIRSWHSMASWILHWTKSTQYPHSSYYSKAAQYPWNADFPSSRPSVWFQFLVMSEFFTSSMESSHMNQSPRWFIKVGSHWRGCHV